MERNKPEFRENVICPSCGHKAVALVDTEMCIIWCEEGCIGDGPAKYANPEVAMKKFLRDSKKNPRAKVIELDATGKSPDELIDMLSEILMTASKPSWGPISEEDTQKYEQQHKASGIKMGDTVEILSKAQTAELGWNNSWVPEMDKMVGKTVTITQDCGKHGFEIAEDGKCYPYFVMQKVIQQGEGVMAPGACSIQ